MPPRSPHAGHRPQPGPRPAPYLWTEETLWLPLSWNRDTLHSVGFYLDGRHVPIPSEWRAPRGPRETCERVSRVGQVAFQQCFVDGDRRGPSRVFRASLDGRAYATFELAKVGKILGAGHAPGSLRGRTFETALACVGPKEMALERPLRGAPEVSRVLHDDGRKLLFQSFREVGVLDLRTSEVEWLEKNEEGSLQPEIIAATASAWLRRREVQQGRRKRYEWRLATRGGFRSAWFRTDVLAPINHVPDALPGGFFVPRSEGGVYVRPRGVPSRGPGLAPTGRIQDPQPFPEVAWPPPTRPVPALGWSLPRELEGQPFRADGSGWPKLQGRLAPPEPQEVRPWSRHLRDFAGLEKALERCNDGVFEACEAARRPWAHHAMPRRLRGVLERIP